MFIFFLDHIMPWSALLPIGCGLLFYARLPVGVRYILLYICIATVLNPLADYVAGKYHNNMPVFHLYAVFEFTCCALFFRSAFTGTWLARFLPVIIFLFAVLSALNAFYVQDIFSFNSYPRTFAAVIIIVLCLVHMYRVLGGKIKATGDSSLTITLGLLLYFSGSLFLFMFSRHLLASRPAVELGWSLHATLVLTMYLFFAVAFYQSRHRA